MRSALSLDKRVINVRNKRLSDDEFFTERSRGLNLWPTGKDINLQSGIEFQKSLPKHKNAVYKLQQAKKEGKVLIQPRGGICLAEEYAKRIKLFQDEGKADIVTAQPDSYTRNERYDIAEKAWNESKKLGISTLNGCPWANWGVKESRRLIEAIDIPLDGRGSIDSFTVEIALNAGATTFLGGFLNYLSYHPNITPEVVLRKQQQVNRLQGFYTEHGVPIASDSHAYSGPSFPVHSLETAQVIIDGLLEIEQGLKYLILRDRQTFSLIQDIAKARAVRELAEEYIKRFGYNDIELFIGYEDWVASFPRDSAQASAMVAMGAIAAHYCGAQNIMVKSLDEGVGLPTNESQVFSLRETKQVLNILQRQNFPFSQEIEDEKNMIIKEARLIIEKVLELGDGDLAIGCIKALDIGVIDHPFSSNRYNAGKVLPTRDVNGMVRYLDCGNLPFTKEIIDYHRAKIDQKKKLEKLEKDYQLMLEDITAFSKDL
ncbi:methylaspartate mutase subunit E [Chloroflexota bacterium]